MKNILQLIFLMSILNSCISQSTNGGFEQFEKEYSQETISKISKNSPYSIKNKTLGSYKYHPYFEIFGNAGILIQYHLKNEELNSIENKLSLYQELDRDYISYDKEGYVNVYTKDNYQIVIPDLRDYFEEIPLSDNESVNEGKIYLIENGEMKNPFSGKNLTMKTNYSNGLVYFRKSSLLIYWFIVYK